eukprot:SAG11_NODE_716_length_7614_cov_63.924837_3_plen_80_part_00
MRVIERRCARAETPRNHIRPRIYAAPPCGAAHGRMRFLGISELFEMCARRNTEETHTAADICCAALRCCARPYVIPRCF